MAKIIANSLDPATFSDQINSPAQRTRRKIAKSVTGFALRGLNLAGFTNKEAHAILAIGCLLYERDYQNSGTPNPAPMNCLGRILAPKTKNEEGRIRTASNICSKIFTEAIPRTGYQAITRYKGDAGKSHLYADHVIAAAALYSEELEGARTSPEWKAIAKITDEIQKAKAYEAFEAPFFHSFLQALPKCDTEVLDAAGDLYAYMSAPEAKALCEIREDLKSRPFAYEPPAEEENLRPIPEEDKKRREDRILQAVDDFYFDLEKRNSPEEARIWVELFEERFARSKRSLLKTAEARRAVPAGKIGGERGGKELIHASEFSGVEEEETPESFSGVSETNVAEIEGLQVPEVWTPPEPSINFDISLDAALEYAREGFAVLPICNFNPETGRCTAEFHDQECKGKKPLAKGKEPGGYSAATRDEKKIREWFLRKFPHAGVGLRLDGHILIDCDVKDGVDGLESYRFLRDTFDIPETRTARTHSGGYHFYFKLPEGLPAEYLKSWTRPLDHKDLKGIDLKVSTRGLAFAEPTIGAKGVYQWIDWTAEIAELPREVCDYFHQAREEKDQAKRKPSQNYASGPRRPVADQSKFFRNVPKGERHARLLAVGTAARCQDKRSAAEIEEIMRQHNAAFAEPLKDDAWFTRTARDIARRF